MSVLRAFSASPGNLSGNPAPAAGQRGKHTGLSKAFEAAIRNADGTNARKHTRETGAPDTPPVRKLVQSGSAPFPEAAAFGAGRHAAKAETGPAKHHDRTEDRQPGRDEPDPATAMPQPMASLLENIRQNRVTSGSGDEEPALRLTAEGMDLETGGDSRAQAVAPDTKAGSTDERATPAATALSGGNRGADKSHADSRPPHPAGRDPVRTAPVAGNAAASWAPARTANVGTTAASSAAAAAAAQPSGVSRSAEEPRVNIRPPRQAGHATNRADHAAGNAAALRTPAQDTNAGAADKREAWNATATASLSGMNQIIEGPRVDTRSAQQVDRPADSIVSFSVNAEATGDDEAGPASSTGMGTLRSALAALDLTSFGATGSMPESGMDATRDRREAAAVDGLVDTTEPSRQMIPEEAGKQEPYGAADPSRPGQGGGNQAAATVLRAAPAPAYPDVSRAQPAMETQAVVQQQEPAAGVVATAATRGADAGLQEETSSGTVRSARSPSARGTAGLAEASSTDLPVSAKDLPVSERAAAGRNDRADPPSSRIEDGTDGQPEQRFETRATASAAPVPGAQAGQQAAASAQSTTLASAVDGLARLLPRQAQQVQAVPGQPLVPAMPGAHSLKIQLRPESLGLVTATLRMQGDKLNVEMTTEKAEAYDRLKGETQALTKSLREMGLQVDQIVVQPPQAAATSAARADTGGAFSNLPGQRDQQQFASGSDASGQGGGAPQRGQARGENDNGSQTRQPASSVNDARSGGSLVI